MNAYNGSKPAGRSRRLDQTLAALCAFVTFSTCAVAAEDGNLVNLANPTDEELREFLKPVPPKSPGELLQTIEAIPGFRLDLVAAEPLVVDPIAGAFDEDGNLYICEMRDYPYKPAADGEPLGTVRLLRDTDGDGVFDLSTVFADKLLWAAGVAPWKGGVFVAAAPDIWYLKDTDGDGVADLRRKVYTGFGTAGQQYMVNNLQFAPDHKIYGTTAANGGTIHTAEPLEEWLRAGKVAPPTKKIPLGRSDFRFDPATGVFEPVSGTVQFGNTFDDWGRRFTCSEARPALHVVLPLEYLARNPALPVGTAIANIAPSPVPVFRTSAIEKWRHIRSGRRIAAGIRSPKAAGVRHDVVDSAAGVTVYRGGAYPREFHGQIFTPEAQHNLIHRRALTGNGATFRSHRVDEDTEFVRSSDQWFRPVNLLNAPDGTLYCLDMSREVIESVHIPLDVIEHLDLTFGRDRGRIYRISPAGFEAPPPPRLSRATSAELVVALESPHGWWRDTALRLIHERQDRTIVPALERLAAESTLPQARLGALWALEGLDALPGGILSAALFDDEPGVRENAAALAEKRFATAPQLLARVLELADDRDARVRFQVALSLGETQDPRALPALVRLARRDDSDDWTRTAILSSVADSSGVIFSELIRDSTFSTSGRGEKFLESLAAVIGSRNDPVEVQQTLAALSAMPASAAETIAPTLLLSVGIGLKRTATRLGSASAPLATTELNNIVARVRQTASSPAASAEARGQSIRLLSCLMLDEARATLLALLVPSQPESVQRAAVHALADYSEPEVADLLLARWPEYLPSIRLAVLQALLSREAHTLTFLRAVENGRIPAAQLEPSRRQQLLKHHNEEIRSIAEKLFAATALGSRQEVVERYKAALALTGSTARGAAVFDRTCSACHRIGSKGQPIGPDLAGSASQEPEALLVNILDPNRYLQPGYILYSAEDRSGRNYSGMIAAETASSITLRRIDGATDTLLRTELLKLSSLGVSLMPEGLEGAISPQAMADLLAFLQEAAGRRPDPSTNEASRRVRDLGSPAGLIEPTR